MTRLFAFLFIGLSAVNVAADPVTLDAALKKYYAGSPQAAIEMIEPIAQAGDVDAQYLLGNLLYSLSTSRGGESLEDSINWYRMAAAQGSAEANYALAVIYENSWRKTRQEVELAYAMVYYGEAADLGLDDAQLRLRRLAQRSGLSRDQALGLYRLSEAQAPKTEQVEPVKTQAVESTDIIESTGVPAAIVVQTPTVEQPIVASQTEQPIAVAETQAEDAPVEPVVAEPEPVPEDQSEAAAVGPPVSLAELSHQCQNLTDNGFAIFAESISGSQFSGSARMIDVKVETFGADRYTARLGSTQSGNTLFITLQGVPKDVADSFQRGIKYQINGIILDTRVSGSRCDVSLQYPSASG